MRRMGEWAHRRKGVSAKRRMGRHGESGGGELFLSALERRTLLCRLRLLRPLCPLSRHAATPSRPFALSPVRRVAS
jgi:hypothetical protein